MLKAGDETQRAKAKNMSAAEERQEAVSTFALTHLASALGRRFPEILEDWRESMERAAPVAEVRSFVPPPAPEVVAGGLLLAGRVKAVSVPAKHRRKRRAK